jgi:adenosylhomocysteinase
MKNGAILCNAGHFDVEVDVKSLREMAEPKKVRSNIEEYTIRGKNVYLLGEGRLVNLACADGHPAEIMDLSFALQVLSARYLLEHELENKLLPVPEELDTQIAERALKTLGITLDVLNEKQKQYMNSWKYTYD